MTPWFAIVGSGPAGCFAADALVRKIPGCRIDVFDRLPSPFGLVRGGVAPDHQGTKAIARQFERLFQREELRFLGTIEIGRDLGLEELRAAYDAVVLAVGAPVDRRLGIPGEELPGVHGSGAFVGWYNGHPDHAAAAPRLDRPGVAIVGNGNVALDVARVLAKTPAELAGADLPATAAAVLAAAPVGDIWIIGRRGAADASFSAPELAELGRLERARPLVDPADIPAGGSKVLDILAGFTALAADHRPQRLRFLFHARPTAVLGSGRVEGLHLATATGDRVLAVGTVVTAIGYQVRPLPGVAVDGAAFRNEEGRIAPGLYVTGWCRRGPSGTIPTNRADAFAVADRVAAELGTPAGEGIDALLARRGRRPVGFADWQRIAAAETGRATPPKPREKFTSAAAMLAVLGRPDGD